MEKVCFYGFPHAEKTELFNFISGLNLVNPSIPNLTPSYHKRFYDEELAVLYWNIPVQSSTYLARSTHICLVFDRCNRRLFKQLPRLLSNCLDLAPDAIISIVSPSTPEREQNTSDEDFVYDDEIDDFLDKHYISPENYFPLCLTSPESMNTLREHILNNTQARRNRPLQIQNPDAVVRKSPSSIYGLFTPITSFVSGLWEASSLNRNSPTKEASVENTKPSI